MELRVDTSLDFQLPPSFCRKVEVCLRTGHYRIRTIETRDELNQVLKLRSDCFQRTFEVNAFELAADHLVVEDMIASAQMVGAYRLTSTDSLDRYETALDFQLRDWLPNDKKSLEVTWACTRPGFREGPVIHLLWRGLAVYLQTAKIDRVFGPATVPAKNSKEFTKIYSYIRSIGQELLGRGMNPKNLNLSALNPRRLMPSLLRAYLMAGALVLLQPVFDPDTDSYDFLTVLEVEKSSPALRSHFQI